MTPKDIFEFLKQGGVKAILIIVVVYGYIKMEKMDLKIDTMQAVIIDCYKDRVQDLMIRTAGLTPDYSERVELFAILPSNPVGEIKRNA